MKRIAMFLLFWLLPCAVELRAQDLKYALHGNIREWVKTFIQSPAEMSLAETRVKLELVSTAGERSAFRALSYYTYDGLTPQSGALELKEAYLDYYSDFVDLRFGKQIMTWGKADELNPTDVLCPQNLANLTEDKAIRKLGLLFLKTDWNIAQKCLALISQALPVPSASGAKARASSPKMTTATIRISRTHISSLCSERIMILAIPSK